MDLKYPQWQEPLAAAILEFDAQQLHRKLQVAEEAIAGRFKELAFEKDNQEELRLLSDGLSILRRLKKDRLGYPATKCEPPQHPAPVQMLITPGNHDCVGIMTRLFHIYRIDDTGVFHWLASAKTQEQAVAEAAREHAKNPLAEYRVINPNIGIIEIIKPVPRPKGAPQYSGSWLTRFPDKLV